MPVEIRELVIKVTVNQDQSKDVSGAGSSGDNEEREAVVREAVEEVLRIIESKKER